MKVTKIYTFLFLLFILLIAGCRSMSNQKPVLVGSKKFTESVVLGELVTQLLTANKINAVHQSELGGTRVLWSALLKGDIDIYPDYTGTIIQELLSNETITNFAELRKSLLAKGIAVTEPLGFNNTYALGMLKSKADKLGITKISDLNDHPELQISFTNEFMDRKDGYPGLRDKYGLIQKNIKGIDHDLAYKGLESGDIDVIDLYSTDAEIDYYNIETLEDDLHYFTQYNAVILYRYDLPEKYPDFKTVLDILENSIDEKEMRKLNSSVKISKVSEAAAAQKFLSEEFGLKSKIEESTFWSRLLDTTVEHFVLVTISMIAAIIFSIPLGIIAYKKKKYGKIILSSIGILQTIPSLALLVFMIPLFGIGAEPAIVALFLYSLLPIVRNTYLGLENIAPAVRESAVVLGISGLTILRKIELPMASRSIIAGIKTSSVINVGTATLGALIGAGGYGQPILTGIRLDNIPMILEGAVPAALLALLVQAVFDLSEYIFVPRGLRLNK